MPYPTTDQIQGSDFIPEQTIRASEAPGGALVTTDDAQGRTVGHFRLVHILTDAQKATHESDYDTNQTATFSLTWQLDSPATTHTVFYRERPQITPRPDSNLWDAVVLLEKVVEYGSRVLEDFTTRTLEDGTTRNLEAA